MKQLRKGPKKLLVLTLSITLMLTAALSGVFADGEIPVEPEITPVAEEPMEKPAEKPTEKKTMKAKATTPTLTDAEQKAFDQLNSDAGEGLRQTARAAMGGVLAATPLVKVTLKSFGGLRR